MTTHDPQLLNQGLRAARRNAIRTLLREVFGVGHLREGQQQVIDRVLDGQDTLAIMPTAAENRCATRFPRACWTASPSWFRR